MSNPVVVALSIIGLALTILILGLSVPCNKTILSTGIFAVVAGAILESVRRNQDVKKMLPPLLFSYCLSFCALLPGKNELRYNFEMHALLWPIAFTIIYIISITTLERKTYTAKLTEGSTLLLSIAAAYWVIDKRLYIFASLPHAFALLAGILFLLFSGFHAFTNSALSTTSRLLLSIWSSFIMLLFSVDYIYRIYKAGQVTTSAGPTETLLISLQFFLLGISALYIVQNFMMLVNFLPDKHNFFNSEHFKRIAETKKAHIERYSDEQVKINHSLLCIFVVIPAFAINYYFDILPCHTSICFLVFAFPYIIVVYDKITASQLIQGKSNI